MRKFLCKIGIHSIKRYRDIKLEQKLNGYSLHGRPVWADHKIERCTCCEKETSRTTNLYTADIMKVPICDGKLKMNNLVNKTPVWL